MQKRGRDTYRKGKQIIKQSYTVFKIKTKRNNKNMKL